MPLFCIAPLECTVIPAVLYLFCSGVQKGIVCVLASDAQLRCCLLRQHQVDRLRLTIPVHLGVCACACVRVCVWVCVYVCVCVHTSMRTGVHVCMWV